MHPYTTHYNQNVVPKLKEFKAYESTYQIPKVTKVSLNCGVGDLVGNGKAIDDIISLLAQISGQQPVATKARKAIAGFKIRQNMVVGYRVTLRGTRMNDFLMKLIQISLPRTRDFRGLKATGVTADGNLNIGIRDSMIFPEAPQEVQSHGLQVTLVSNASSQEEARLFYEALGFVFNPEAEVKKKTVKRNYKRK